MINPTKLNSNEKLAIEFRDHLADVLSRNPDEALMRLQDAMADAVERPIQLQFLNSLIYIIRGAFLVPMNEEFFIGSIGKYEAEVNGQIIDQVFRSSHPQLWVFTDFACKRKTTRQGRPIIPEGYDCLGILTNVEPSLASSVFFFFVKKGDPLPYVWGQRFEATDRLTGDLNWLGAIATAAHRRYGNEIRTAEEIMKNHDGRYSGMVLRGKDFAKMNEANQSRGWRLIGYKS